VQAVASQDGLLLSRDGTRFVKLDAKQSPVFMLQFGDTNFLRDDLTYKGGQMITLVLDVPVADEDILPFRLMCDYAKSLAERIGGRVVDDGRRPLPETALLAIEKQLMTLYAKLEQAGIPAGRCRFRRSLYDAPYVMSASTIVAPREHCSDPRNRHSADVKGRASCDNPMSEFH
jgi:hypothetical protein